MFVPDGPPAANLPQMTDQLPTPPPVPAPKAPSKTRLYIIGAVVLVLIAAGAYAISQNQLASDLAVGQCFDEPTSEVDITTVVKHACTESHDAEVFHVVEYDGGTTYPISLTLESYIDTTCVPAFATYVGADLDARLDLAIGYFYPSRDGWNDGDRTITCYVANDDESKLTKSLKGTGAGG